jgi:hypothetical protein
MIVYICPTPSNGLSTVFAPIQVRMITVVENIQNVAFFKGLNFVLVFFFITRIFKIRIEAARAMTPPSFDGMERKIT